ncbi:hypothetical protein DY000_02061213 [Brassica cretica]|uniref:F-box domain-containing protein n=1 Tax=Brassica cretica TaxID=69181 RepID=A0ABQ7AQL1_BRACR|nr:hypothetical protein DY000_02061213 [Brassica cretica]
MYVSCSSLAKGTIKEEAGLRDLLSWLPEEVLGSILSLLPTKQAASTSVLAKTWRHVCRLVHNLDFNDYDHVLPPEEEECGRKWNLIRESFRKFDQEVLSKMSLSQGKRNGSCEWLDM